MSSADWTVTASADRPGWILMPQLGNAGDDERWVRERAEGLRLAFGDRWTAELEGLVPQVLRGGLEQRDVADLLALQVWPIALPLALTVQVRVVASSGVPDLHEEGVSLQPHRSPTLGDGVVARAVDAEPELGKKISTLLYVFDDGESAVVVMVPPTLAELLALAAPGLRSLVDRMEVLRPDGTPFQGTQLEFVMAPDAWLAEGEGTWT